MKNCISVSLDTDVFKKIERMRGTKPHFRSGFINDVLRERLGLPDKAPDKTEQPAGA